MRRKLLLLVAVFALLGAGWFASLPKEGRDFYLVRAGAANDLATRWFAKAAENGEISPENGNPPSGWFLSQAEDGNPVAQYILGRMLRSGEGYPKNCTDALKWLWLSAEQGFAMSEYTLADSYMIQTDQCGEKDIHRARELYQRSARGGYAPAQEELYREYEGEGGAFPQDLQKAISWLYLAAIQGRERSQFLLGRNYAEGKGVPQDYIRAYMWLYLSGEGKALLSKIVPQMTTQQLADADRLINRWHPQ